MELYNNEINKPLKFKLNIEGADTNKIEPRLILNSKNENYLFYGKIDDNVCVFDLPKLSMYEKGISGNIKFEIISEDLYFNVWEDNFEVKSKTSITFEKMVNNVQNETNKDTKPRISAVSVNEKDDFIETEKDIKKSNKEKKLDTKEKNDITEKKDNKKIEKNQYGVKNFNSYFG